MRGRRTGNGTSCTRRLITNYDIIVTPTYAGRGARVHTTGTRTPATTVALRTDGTTLPRRSGRSTTRAQDPADPRSASAHDPMAW